MLPVEEVRPRVPLDGLRRDDAQEIDLARIVEVSEQADRRALPVQRNAAVFGKQGVDQRPVAPLSQYRIPVGQMGVVHFWNISCTRADASPPTATGREKLRAALGSCGRADPNRVQPYLLPLRFFVDAGFRFGSEAFRLAAAFTRA
jgi:hypothetical protein